MKTPFLIQQTDGENLFARVIWIDGAFDPARHIDPILELCCWMDLANDAFSRGDDTAIDGVGALDADGMLAAYPGLIDHALNQMQSAMDAADKMVPIAESEGE